MNHGDSPCSSHFTPLVDKHYKMWVVTSLGSDTVTEEMREKKKKKKTQADEIFSDAYSPQFF